MKNSLFLRLFLGFAAVIGLLSLSVAWLAPAAMRDHHFRERSADLERLALLLEERIVPLLGGTSASDLDAVVVRLAGFAGCRITVTDTAGIVLADSNGPASDMESHLLRPEIQASLRGETKISVRTSSTLKKDMMYLSVPLEDGGRIVGALRLGLFMKDFEGLMGTLRSDLMNVLGVVALVALGLSLALARSVSAPVREVLDASARVSAGDFDIRVSTRRRGELRDLARGFNAMTARLGSLFGELKAKNEEIEGILGSIREGLCVIDGDSRIVLCNAGFRNLTGAPVPVGIHLWEAVRSSALADAVRSVRASKTGVSREVTFGARRCVCSVIPFPSGDRIVLTIRDITSLFGSDKG